MHGALWDRLGDDLDPLPEGEPLTLAAYVADLPVQAYCEHLAVGKPLTEMPLFLDPDSYVKTPLEKTYQVAWQGTPPPWRRVLESGARPHKKKRS